MSKLVASPVGGGDDRRSAIGVLTVDDQPVFRHVMRTLVDATPGFEHVGAAASGPEGIAAAGELHPDLVLLDVRMPGMDGIETARHLRTVVPEAVVVLVSLDEPANIETLAAGCGAAAYVRKQDLSPSALTGLWAASKPGDRP